MTRCVHTRVAPQVNKVISPSEVLRASKGITVSKAPGLRGISCGVLKYLRKCATDFRSARQAALPTTMGIYRMVSIQEAEITLSNLLCVDQWVY